LIEKALLSFRGAEPAFDLDAKLWIPCTEVRQEDRSLFIGQL
jgi:hypothetical protein